MNVLVVGASGMIGSTVLRILSEKSDWSVYGTVRNAPVKAFFRQEIQEKIIDGVDVLDQDGLLAVFDSVRPDVVVNCAGLTKHKAGAENPLLCIPMNALVPHRLAALCKLAGTRLIHVSTDCVFSGEKGGYVEEDFADARDLYGQSKALGEVQCPNVVTVRTSTIGHELQSRYGLLEWFLSQGEVCRGYTKAIFSGVPTVVFAQVIRDEIIPRKDLSGLYHVAAEPIAKFDLLKMIADIYGKNIEVVPDDGLAIDRSLNAERFRLATGYVAPAWPELIKIMHAYK